MKLYRHLAWDGIRKNSRLYVPYLLTGVGAVSFPRKFLSGSHRS